LAASTSGGYSYCRATSATSSFSGIYAGFCTPASQTDGIRPDTGRFALL
jgi:hypothetical protein